MASITINPTTGLYTLTGPGFYAVLNSNTDRTIYDVGYIATTAKLRSIRPVLADTVGLEAIFGGKLPAFLFILHQGGVELSNPDVEHDIDAAIRTAGLDFSIGAAGYVQGEYDYVEALDFCVLTGRKDYPRLADHMKLPQNFNATTGLYEITERPPLQDVPNGAEDFFLEVIKHLGLSGIIARMYAKEAMSWKEYLVCADHFWRGDAQRINVELARLQFLVPLLLGPSLNQAKKGQLLAIAAPEPIEI